MNRQRLVFSGSGGQGVITAAVILAEAAVIYEGMNATQSQSYGAAARGGDTRSDIILSDSEIHFPEVIQPNILVCLTQGSYNTLSSVIRPGGFLLTDPRFVTPTRKVDARQIEIPMYETVMENICMLGGLIGFTQLVKPESIMEVLKTRVPGDFIEMNRTALEIGMELGAARKN